MKPMIVLSNKKYCAFFNIGEESIARELRKSDKRMKYARIKIVIQAFPSKMEMRVIYERT